MLDYQQVGDELPDQWVTAHQLGTDLLGLPQRADRFIAMTALSVSAGHVDQQPGPPFG